MAGLDYGNRIATAGGAEVGVRGCGVGRGRAEIGDHLGQQRFERIGNEAEVWPGAQQPFVTQRSAQWSCPAHRQVSRLGPKPACLFSPIACPLPIDRQKPLA